MKTQEAVEQTLAIVEILEWVLNPEIGEFSSIVAPDERKEG
ncbi:MAG: hypothetical protein ACRDHZ_01025 [Ktedonobacteraceae bacterium]